MRVQTLRDIYLCGCQVLTPFEEVQIHTAESLFSIYAKDGLVSRSFANQLPANLVSFANLDFNARQDNVNLHVL